MYLKGSVYVDAKSQMKPSVSMVTSVSFDGVRMTMLDKFERKVSCLLPIHVEVGTEAVLTGRV